MGFLRCYSYWVLGVQDIWNTIQFRFQQASREGPGSPTIQAIGFWPPWTQRIPGGWSLSSNASICQKAKFSLKRVRRGETFFPYGFGCLSRLKASETAGFPKFATFGREFWFGPLV